MTKEERINQLEREIEALANDLSIKENKLIKKNEELLSLKRVVQFSEQKK